MALVYGRFAPANPNLYFYPAVFPIKPECDQGLALNCACRKEFLNLRLVKQEFSRPLGIVLCMAGTFVGLNIRVVQKEFPVLDLRKRIVQVSQTGSDGFDFGAAEFNSSLYFIEDLIVVERPAI